MKRLMNRKLPMVSIVLVTGGVLAWSAENPYIRIDRPAEGATVTTPKVEFQGQVRKLPRRSQGFFVARKRITRTAGPFKCEVSLKPGRNVIPLEVASSTGSSRQAIEGPPTGGGPDMVVNNGLILRTVIYQPKTKPRRLTARMTDARLLDGWGRKLEVHGQITGGAPPYLVVLNGARYNLKKAGPFKLRTRSFPHKKFDSVRLHLMDSEYAHRTWDGKVLLDQFPSAALVLFPPKPDLICAQRNALASITGICSAEVSWLTAGGVKATFRDGTGKPIKMSPAREKTQTRFTPRKLTMTWKEIQAPLVGAIVGPQKKGPKSIGPTGQIIFRKKTLARWDALAVKLPCGLGKVEIKGQMRDGTRFACYLPTRLLPIDLGPDYNPRKQLRDTVALSFTVREPRKVTALGIMMNGALRRTTNFMIWNTREAPWESVRLCHFVCYGNERWRTALK